MKTMKRVDIARVPLPYRGAYYLELELYIQSLCSAEPNGVDRNLLRGNFVNRTNYCQ